VTSWYGLLAPKAIPKPVLDAIFGVTSEILKTQTLQQKLEEQGLSVKIEAPDIFAERIRRETAVWRDLIQQRKITAN
jgi:tripartite-type tricarboxylate transporter receptor subunit TctC